MPPGLDTPALPRMAMLGCGVVRHPGGMVKGESRLEGFLRIKAKGLHDGVCLLRKATSLQEYRLAGRPGTICDARWRIEPHTLVSTCRRAERRGEESAGAALTSLHILRRQGKSDEVRHHHLKNKIRGGPRERRLIAWSPQVRSLPAKAFTS